MGKAGNKKKLNKNHKGFSLVEVIIAMVVLAIIAVPICHAFVTAARTNAKARKQASANAVAENVMEGINAYSYEELVRQFAEVPVGEFLIAENCDAKSVVSGWTNPEGTIAGNTMVYQICGVEEDVYTFDIKVTVDASTYIAGAGEEAGFNDQELAVITNYNPEKDYMFAQEKEDEILAYQALAARSGAQNASDFEGKVKRTICITLEKEEDPDTVFVTNTITYEYVGAEGWLTGSDAIYTKTYGTHQYIGEELLRNAYICYIPNYASRMATPTMDEIVIENADNVEANIFLIKQVDGSGSTLEVKENQYVPTVSVTEGKWEDGQSAAYLSIHTNYGTNLVTGAVIPSSAGAQFKYEYTDSENQLRSGSGEDAQLLLDAGSAVETQKKNRMFSVSVEVYDSGAYGHFTDGTALSIEAHLNSD